MELSEIKSFSDIVGQRILVKYLRRIAENRRPAHAYLFLGQEGVGRKTIAYAFAMAINCRDLKEGDACGICPTCRQIKKGTSGQIIHIEPEGQNIKISQIRELMRKMEYRTERGLWRVVIIDKAEYMNPESANSFLKTLEEPYPWNIIILIVSDINSVLHTIRSRAQRINFSPLPLSDMVDWIVERFHISHEDARIIAINSEGSLGRAQELIQTDFLIKRHEYLMKLMEIISYSHDELLEFAHVLSKGHKGDKEKGVFGGDKLGELLCVWKTWFRDLMALKAGAGEEILINVDYSKRLSNISMKHELDELINCMEHIERLERDLGGSKNIEISISNLLFGLQRNYKMKGIRLSA